MPISIKCPNAACRQPLKVKDEMAGKAGRCPKCQTALRIPAANGSLAAPPPPAPPAPARAAHTRPAPPPPPRHEDEDEDRPRKKGRPDREDNFDDRPPPRKGR